MTRVGDRIVGCEPEPLDEGNLAVTRRRSVLASGIVLALLIGGCSTSGSEESTEIADPESAPISETPRTPEPTAEQAAAIESAVADIYPGVPEGKATDWARSTCSDLLRNEFDENELAQRVIMRFSGGDRPDPTSDQALMILAAIESGGWCA